MQFEAWMSELADTDTLIAVLGNDLVTIYRYQVEYYRSHNPGCTFRPMTEEQRKEHDAFLDSYAKSIHKDATRWARL